MTMIQAHNASIHPSKGDSTGGQTDGQKPR